LVQAAVTGGETSPISCPFPGVRLLDISPDHSQLLVGNFVSAWSVSASAKRYEATEFWALPLPSGPPRRIADVRGDAGMWSPDGHQLVFTNGGNVYLAKADGTDAHKLLSMATGTRGPASAL